ncbi:distal flagellar hook-filament junction protein FlgL [Arcobacter acticola]|uniref:Distal flagellar hook-filament junction protein FlgL n=1 Tax=Arcobacter acticola TaxID=1849015 RepID=A0A6M8EDV9_9BACT|nr:flagellar hook-associated protein FlgL [Arcobacter acticola]QKE28730.1 distal flagellar hook-filament junction protein FlgL [Arcobacter acticola]
MVSSINNIMFNLDMLNKRNEKNTYGLSSGEALQYGSDNAKQYNEILSVKNNVKTYTSILDKIQLSNSYNTTSDTAVSNMKTALNSAQSLVMEALNGTNNSDTKEIIATNIESIKDTIFNLSNSSVNEQYVFSGKNTDSASFEKDASGKVTYTGSNDNKTLNVEDKTYATQGVNGIELLYTTNQTAQENSDLTFSADEMILDNDGNEYQLVDTTGTGDYGLFLNGDNVNNSNVASSFFTVNGDGTYTASLVSVALESKTSIFDTLDEIINALRQQDSSGNAITEDAANQVLSNSLEKINSAYDNVNLNHAILGTRTSYIDNYEQITEAKLTNFNILYETYAGADLTALAIESQSLQNTYTALYSTISKINSLSLVDYLK